MAGNSFSKEFLSGSTNGRGIKVGATATPGTTIHTAPAGVTSKDEVFIYATVNHTASVDLTLEFGGTTSPDDRVTVTIQPKAGLYLVLPGLDLNNGLVIKAFASVTNVVSIFGFVNRITPS